MTTSSTSCDLKIKPKFNIKYFFNRGSTSGDTKLSFAKEERMYNMLYRNKLTIYKQENLN